MLYKQLNAILHTKYCIVQAVNRYALPVPKDKMERVDRTSSPAHTGRLKNAIDFIVPQGTTVFAAADGVVTSVELLDAAGETIALFFGERKPGKPEREDWRALVAQLGTADSLAA